jgi:hypothetical protein
MFHGYESLPRFKYAGIDGVNETPMLVGNVRLDRFLSAKLRPLTVTLVAFVIEVVVAVSVGSAFRTTPSTP